MLGFDTVAEGGKEFWFYRLGPQLGSSSSRLPTFPQVHFVTCCFLVFSLEVKKGLSAHCPPNLTPIWAGSTASNLKYVSSSALREIEHVPGPAAVQGGQGAAPGAARAAVCPGRGPGPLTDSCCRRSHGSARCRDGRIPSTSGPGSGPAASD